MGGVPGPPRRGPVPGAVVLSWQTEILRWARSGDVDLGLDPARIEVQRVINPSGWHANLSFTLTDGRTRLHGKVSDDPGTQDDLRSWYDVRDVLWGRYRAPKVVRWIEARPYAGLLMRSIDGRTASELFDHARRSSGSGFRTLSSPVREAGALLTEVVGLAGALHADDALAELLDEGRGTVRDAFDDLWIGRFTSDLDELEAGDAMPPFVSPATVEWMRGEIAALVRQLGSPAFDAPALSPTHGDLHLGNVIVDSDSRWWVVDWDNLGLGDPAVDLAILLWPLTSKGMPVDPLLGERTAEFRERFALSTRAVLLDGVIDSLSDYAGADAVPESADALRERMRATHVRSLDEYRRRYV